MSRTTPLRRSIRFTDDRTVLHQVLDEGYVAHIGMVVDGEPRVLPMFHVRVGEHVYVHGSTGGRFGLGARDGELRLCLSVTLLDGLVLAKSQFHHTANYRSVVVHGAARVVTDPVERDTVLAAFVDKIAAGRSADARPANDKELAQTSLLAIDLTEATIKARAGGPMDDDEDLALPFWSGVLPMSTVRGVPVPHGTEPQPSYLARSPWLFPEVLEGEKVRLEPLSPAHAQELFESSQDDDVWSWLSTPRPSTPDGMAAVIRAALTTADRVPWAQIDTATGRVIGTTSFYEIDEANRSLGIGYTWIGKPWWRSGVNSESKYLLLTRAFDDLGALRVTWHTDRMNTRSQAAIERLGATLEGVIRNHRIRPDGTMRDTYLYGMTAAEWPAARARMEESLCWVSPTSGHMSSARS
ncbi:bifunctional pyridoxamine 5'-phosphate oxidase family protein/GNAT family N-acetyltransferase [Longispora albida]|uniref:bifunctional pyridoxamine 5'-phosphate oxidase family protein/GNAT family N-acetyltransferase n=1 Tax=Longispora albida TaxID=203523 RepID=UPI000369B07D|nr:bifunctional pyridoxamine 5'-phosphate oxidase family protein/GNAT family N-acetyltransferase [Longispora albida]